jgi:hypothetical protein
MLLQFLYSGWKNSLLTAAMKKAKFFRVKLNATGDAVVPTPAGSASPLTIRSVYSGLKTGIEIWQFLRMEEPFLHP